MLLDDKAIKAIINSGISQRPEPPIEPPDSSIISGTTGATKATEPANAAVEVITPNRAKRIILNIEVSLNFYENATISFYRKLC